METKTRNFNNPYYPYEKVQIGYNTLKGAELIPQKLLTYLLDLPDKYGYEPVDDNDRARVRFIKYLYYDEANPLAKPLPTREQKLSLLYDGSNPAITTEEDKRRHPKGYRLFGQNYTKPTEVSANTIVKCYMGRIIPRDDYKTMLGIVFEIVTNYALIDSVKTTVANRNYAIMQCIVEALHGVDLTGIGTVYFSKPAHGDSGMTLYHDEGDSSYVTLFMAIEWRESEYPNNVVQDW